uniref:Uncharacterized protein n=1 Tax=Triticum urartu TaxID=4572 RepID=A0A8R7VFI3_TRIUA
MNFSNLVGRCFAPSPTGTEWGTQALQCLPSDPLTWKSYSKLFWLTVRTPLHPGSRPLPRKLWSVKSGIRIPLQCLEWQRKLNRILLLLIGRDDLKSCGQFGQGHYKRAMLYDFALFTRVSDLHLPIYGFTCEVELSLKLLRSVIHLRLPL